MFYPKITSHNTPSPCVDYKEEVHPTESPAARIAQKALLLTEAKQPPSTTLLTVQNQEEIDPLTTLFSTGDGRSLLPLFEQQKMQTCIRERIQITDSNGSVLLHHLFGNKSLSALSEVLERRSFQDGIKKGLHIPNPLGNTPLHILFERGSAAALATLLEAFPDEVILGAEKKNRYGETPLHLLFAHNKSPAIAVVLADDRLLDLIKKLDATLLDALFKNTDQNTIQHVIQQRPIALLTKKHFLTEVDRWDGRNLLHSLCEYGTEAAISAILSFEDFRSLIAHALSVIDGYGRTPVHYLFDAKRTVAISKLFDIPEYQSTAERALLLINAQGTLYLHELLKNHTSPLIRFLLSQDSVHTLIEKFFFKEDDYGNTLLHALAENIDQAVFLTFLRNPIFYPLIKQGLTKKNKKGETALLFSIGGNQRAFLAMLADRELQQCIYKELRREGGKTLLYQIAQKDHPAAFLALLKYPPFKQVIREELVDQESLLIECCVTSSSPAGTLALLQDEELRPFIEKRLEKVDDEEGSLLHILCREGNTTVIEIFLKDPNLRPTIKKNIEKLKKAVICSKSVRETALLALLRDPEFRIIVKKWLITPDASGRLLIDTLFEYPNPSQVDVSDIMRDPELFSLIKEQAKKRAKFPLQLLSRNNSQASILLRDQEFRSWMKKWMMIPDSTGYTLIEFLFQHGRPSIHFFLKDVEFRTMIKNWMTTPSQTAAFRLDRLFTGDFSHSLSLILKNEEIQTEMTKRIERQDEQLNRILYSFLQSRKPLLANLDNCPFFHKWLVLQNRSGTTPLDFLLKQCGGTSLSKFIGNKSFDWLLKYKISRSGDFLFQKFFSEIRENSPLFALLRSCSFRTIVEKWMTTGTPSEQMPLYRIFERGSPAVITALLANKALHTVISKNLEGRFFKIPAPLKYLLKGRNKGALRALLSDKELSDIAWIKLHTVNSSHLLHPITEPEEPPEIKEPIALDALPAFLEQVPFENKQAPGYLPLPSVPTDGEGDQDSIPLTRKDLQTGISHLITDIREKTPLFGTPKKDEPEEADKYYRKLRNIMGHLIAKWRELAKPIEKESSLEEDLRLKKRNRLIVDLAVAFLNCGTGRMEPAIELYERYCVKKEENNWVKRYTLHEMILKILQKRRNRLAAGIVEQEGKGEVHIRNDFYYFAGNQLGLSRTGYRDPSTSTFNRERVSRMIQYFHLSYNPFSIVNLILKNLYVKKTTIPRKLIVNWLKVNIPNDFDSTRYSTWKREVDTMRKAGKKESVILSHLAKAHGITFQKTLDDVLFTIKQALFAKNHSTRAGWDGDLPNQAEMKEGTRKRRRAIRFSDLRRQLEKMQENGQLTQCGKQLLLKYDIPTDGFKDSFSALEAARKASYIADNMPKEWDTEDRFFAKLVNTTKEQILQALRQKRLDDQLIKRAFARYKTPEELIEEERAYRYLESVHTEDGHLSKKAICHLLTSHKILSLPEWIATDCNRLPNREG